MVKKISGHKKGINSRLQSSVQSDASQLLFIMYD